MNRTRISWGWVSLALGIAMVACLGPALAMSLGSADKRDYLHISAPPPAELGREIDRARIDMMSTGRRPDDYFVTLLQASKLTTYAQMYHIKGGTSGAIIVWPVSEQGAVDSMMNAYEMVYGHSAMISAAARNQELIKQTTYWQNAGEERYDWERFGRLFGGGYVFSVLLGTAFLTARCKDKDMRILTELDKILLFSLAWPVMVWKYPTYINPVEQAKRFAKRVGAFAQTVSSGISGSDDSNVRVLQPVEIPTPTLNFSSGIESLKAVGDGTVVHNGPVAWADVNTTFGNGVNFDIWSSRALSGSNGSDEVDATVSKPWDLHDANVRLTTGLGYFDIQPIGSSAGGDVVSPFAEADYNVGHDLKAFTRLDVYLLTKGSPSRDGLLVTEGLHFKTLDLGHRLHLDQTLSTVHGDGPFGQKPGVLARYDGTVTIPVTKHLTATLFELKSWIPLLGAEDRTFAWSVGSSLSLAF